MVAQVNTEEMVLDEVHQEPMGEQASILMMLLQVLLVVAAMLYWRKDRFSLEVGVDIVGLSIHLEVAAATIETELEAPEAWRLAGEVEVVVQRSFAKVYNDLNLVPGVWVEVVISWVILRKN